MDDIAKYNEQLRANILHLLRRIESGQATKEYVSFQLLMSLVDAAEHGTTHRQIMDAYPIEDWKSDTVTVPLSVAKCISDSWIQYCATDSSVTLGNAFGLEGGQGKSPVMKTNQTLNAEIRRAKEVIIEKLIAEQSEEPFKLEAAFFRVAEAETLRTGKKVSSDTVKAAFKKHGKRIIAQGREKLREVSNPTS